MPERPNDPGRAFFSLDNVTFRLGDRLVFENTSWTCGRNEQWAVIGPNGGGKSILADGLRGRLPLVQGEIRYRFRAPPGKTTEDLIGHVAFEDRKSELHGTVVQSRWTSFEEESSLKVSEFLSFERVLDVNPFEVVADDGTARVQFERRLRRAVRWLELEKFWPRRLLSLSNGERQRVQLARALAQPLRLLILDEPYVGLDKASRQTFHRILALLVKAGLKVLLVTARVEELPSQISHLLYVEECRVIRAGPRSAVLEKHAQSGAARISATHLPHSLATKRSQSRQAAPGRTLVALRDVTVRYGDNVVLNRLSWTVREGESWALLGPNGSGKTTLLSLIQGDHPQAYMNDVTVFGRRRGAGESVWHLKRQIGWVSPELQLHFNESVSVLETVLCGFYDTIGLFDTPTSHQLAAARRWLKRFGLAQDAEQPLYSLSAGLQRMALLARALVKQPRLLILDEPCQGLDPVHRDSIIEQVEALIRSGLATTIYVTHRPQEIPGSVHRVLRLAKP